MRISLNAFIGVSGLLVAILTFSTTSLAGGHSKSSIAKGVPVIPQCVKAWNKLGSKKALKFAATLVKSNCQIMYKSKWLKGKGNSDPKTCAPAWNNLKKRKVLRNAKQLVTRNCPIMYKRGWRRP